MEDDASDELFYLGDVKCTVLIFFCTNSVIKISLMTLGALSKEANETGLCSLKGFFYPLLNDIQIFKIASRWVNKFFLIKNRKKCLL